MSEDPHVSEGQAPSEQAYGQLPQGKTTPRARGVNQSRIKTAH